MAYEKKRTRLFIKNEKGKKDSFFHRSKKLEIDYVIEKVKAIPVTGFGDL
jgi:hypothetical protein